MTVKDILYSVCNDREMSFSQAAENIGVSKGSLGNQMRHENGMKMKLETVIRDFGMLECEVYVIDAQTGAEYILDGDDDEVELFTAHCTDGEW